MNLDCIDYPCKHRQDDFDRDCYCNLYKRSVPENVNVTGCKDFIFAQTCLDCKHSLRTTYETGIIDDIEYRCPFQNNKLTYDDLNVYSTHYADVPECNCDKFEL